MKHIKKININEDINSIQVNPTSGEEHWVGREEGPRFEKTWEDFTIAGAGKLRLDAKLAKTGSATGLKIGVTWGKYGLTPGVIDFKEAKRLADFLYEQIEKHK